MPVSGSGVMFVEYHWQLERQAAGKGLAPWGGVARRAIRRPSEILAARDQIGVGEAHGGSGRVRSVEIRERDPLAFGKGGGVARTKRPPSGRGDCDQDNGKKTEFPGAAHLATLLRIPA